MDKVNDYNLRVGRDCFLAAAAFASLPREVAAPAAFVGAAFVALYYLEGKIPQEP